MDAQGAADVTRLLRACVDEAGAPARIGRPSVPLDEFHWVPPCPRLFQPDPLGSYKTYDWSGLDGLASLAIDRVVGDRLAALRTLRPNIDALRLGWLFVAGPAPDGRRVFLPLVSVPVKVTRGSILGPAYLAPAGDAVLSRWLPTDARRSLTEQLHLGGPLVADLADPAIPEAVLDRLSGLRRFALAATAALGLPAQRLVPARRPATAHRDGDELVVVAGFGVYAERHEEPPGTPSTSVRHWLPALGRTETALHVLAGAVPGALHDDDRRPVLSPLVLSGVQRDLVRASRASPLTVVSGPIGTGKTTLAAAVAADAAARGDRVLLVAGGAAAVDDLVGALLATSATPPIAFGSTDRRADVLTRLVETRHPIPIADAAEASVARDRAVAELARRRESVARELRAEQAWLRRRTGLAARAAAWAPGLFAAGADLERARELAAELDRRPAGPVAVHRRARARRHLARMAGAGRRAPADALRAAVDEAVAEAGADVLEAIGGVDLESAWGRLLAVEDFARAEIARGRVAEVRNHEGAGRSRLTILRTIGEVHRALRNDRSRRRLQLAQISTVRLTAVLPVWAGTLADVDELLPLRAGLFDLVVVDDATTVTPGLAAAALLRSRPRLVVLGDPDRLAVDSSLFDLAAARRAPVRLTEHFRTPPQIAGRSLGDDAVPARAPRAETAVTALRVDTAEAATAAVARIVERAPRVAGVGVGVVTATPERAAAVERVLLETVATDVIERLRVCVCAAGDPVRWTRDLVVADLTGAGAAGDALVRSIATRALRRLVVVHDGSELAMAVLAATSAPLPTIPVDAADTWTAAVVTVLAEAGFRPERGVRSGRHVLDVAAECGAGPTAVITRLHADGVDAHIDRHLELARRGWRVIEVFPSRWTDRLEKLPDHIENRWRG